MPYYPDDYGVLGTRTARDEDGKNVEVNGKLKYPEWKERILKNGVENDGESGINELVKSNTIKNVTYEDVLSDYIENAQPKGVFAEDDKVGADEVSVAKLLYNQYGGDIKVKKAVNKDKVMTPDYEWNGKDWELKNVSSVNAGDSATRKALKQIANNPGGIVMNLETYDVDIEKLRGVIIDRFARQNRCKDIDVILIKNNNVIDICNYKKK